MAAYHGAIQSYIYHPEQFGGAGAKAVSGSEGEDDAASEGDDEEGDDEEGGDEGTVAAQSKHERRQARMRARIAALEEANMGDKDWFMRGEAKGGKQ